MEHRKFRVKGKHYTNPILEDDYVIADYKDIEVFDSTQSNWNFQRHKNYSKTLSKTIKF